MLVGTFAAPIISGPLDILIYAVLILMLASAIVSVLLRDAVYAVGAFAATMLLVAILYLTIAPFLLFAVQLLIFTLVSAVLLLALLRDTTGLQRSAVGPFSREWIAGAAVSAAVLALVAVVVGATSWPVRLGPQGVLCCPSLAGSITSGYVVGLAIVVILLATAALGAGLMLRAVPPPRPSTQARAKPTAGGRRRR